MASKKPLLCKLGFHDTYYDCAFLSQVERCNNCDWTASKGELETLEHERKLWDEARDAGLTGFNDQLKYVAPRLLRFISNSPTAR